MNKSTGREGCMTMSTEGCMNKSARRDGCMTRRIRTIRMKWDKNHILAGWSL